jgi:hypothetical protein
MELVNLLVMYEFALVDERAYHMHVNTVYFLGEVVMGFNIAP